jgi:hypothetical protein
MSRRFWMSLIASLMLSRANAGADVPISIPTSPAGQPVQVLGVSVTDQVIAKYQNVSTKTITDVVLTYLFDDTPGHTIGQLQETAKGTLLPGAITDRGGLYYPGSVDSHRILWVYISEDRWPQRIGQVRAIVDAVTFADGTTWNSSRYSAPGSTRFGLDDRRPDAHLQISDVRAGTQPGSSSSPTFDRIYMTCSFVNTAAETATWIEFVYTYYSADGTILATAKTGLTGSFAPGVATKNLSKTEADVAGTIQAKGALFAGNGADARYVAFVGVTADEIHYGKNVWRATSP